MDDTLEVILTYLNSFGFTPDDVKTNSEKTVSYKISHFFIYLQDYDILVIDTNEFNLVARMFDDSWFIETAFRLFVGTLIGKDLSTSRILLSKVPS